MGNLITNIKKELDLLASRKIEIDEVNSFGIILGPYRNLTTLTASLLFLHPNCQVLNHAGERIIGDSRLDFLESYSDQKFQNFTRYALLIARGGKRGNYGGSITLSHAFQDQTKMKKIYEDSNISMRKEDVHCLLWKESQRVTNHIRDSKVDLEILLDKNPKLKFILPIRNPLDCAASNSGSGFANILPGVDSASSEKEVLKVILDEYVWFLKLEQQFPDHFYHYFAHQNGKAVLNGLANFLELEPRQTWLKKAGKAFIIKSKYSHQTQLYERYKYLVNDLFQGFPEFCDDLLKFIR